MKVAYCFKRFSTIFYIPYAYDVISLRPHLGDIGLHINTVVSYVPAADHKHIQGNGSCPQHGGG